MTNENTEAIKDVSAKLIKAKMWAEAYSYILIFWRTLQNNYEDWLVGDDGIIYQMPTEIWQRLVGRVGSDKLSDSAKSKILKRYKADKRKEKAEEKAERKDHIVSKSDLAKIDKKLGYSSNSIFTDKRTTRAGNDPHGYFSSGF